MESMRRAHSCYEFYEYPQTTPPFDIDAPQALTNFSPKLRSIRLSSRQKISAQISMFSNLHSSRLDLRFLFISATLVAAQAETLTLNLSEGVNQVSIPLNLANPSPTSVFGPLGDAFIEASTYDNQTKIWSYFRNPNTAGAPASNIFPTLAMGSISPGKGYLIRVSRAVSLTINGTRSASPSVTLYPGLNFVGFPLPPNSPTEVGLQDLLNGPNFRFDTAFEFGSGKYRPFINNGINDDLITKFNPQKALWVESSALTNQIWTPEIAQPPLVYFGTGNTIVVEAPIPEDSAPKTIDLPVNVARSFTGSIGFIASGTAHPETDFSISSITTPVTPTNSTGAVSITSGMVSFPIPVSIKQKSKLQTNSSVIVTLRRPVENPPVQDSGTLPQVAHIKITDGKNGIYDGFLRGNVNASGFIGQNFRIALRSNGNAIFDPEEGGMISSRFTLPYTLSEGIPQFGGNASMTLATTSTLKKEINLSIVPSASISLNEPSAPPLSFEVPIRFTFLNLVPTGEFHLEGKFIFTLSDPKL